MQKRSRTKNQNEELFAVSSFFQSTCSYIQTVLPPLHLNFSPVNNRVKQQPTNGNMSIVWTGSPSVNKWLRPRKDTSTSQPVLILPTGANGPSGGASSNTTDADAYIQHTRECRRKWCPIPSGAQPPTGRRRRSQNCRSPPRDTRCTDYFTRQCESRKCPAEEVQ